MSSPPEDPPSQVFTYGTLQSERVLRAVLGRVPAHEPATLHGHRRVCLHARCYPGVVRAPDHTVSGKLLVDLSRGELDTLDAFEDPAYERAVCSVALPGRRHPVRARVWLRAAPTAPLPELEEGDVDLAAPDWSFDRFLADDEDWYVRACGAWAAARRSAQG